MPIDAGETFDLIVNGTVEADGISNGGTTGDIEVTPGEAFPIDELGDSADLADYNTVISGDADCSDESLTLDPGETVDCT